jgi:selenocysteine lyase/cysteine desulfurase
MVDIYAKEFELSRDICHLNHAAVGPWPKRTVEAVRRFAEENGTYGSQHYARWLTTEQSLREQLQFLIHARSSAEIALLKNTSEALSVVAYGIDWRPGDEVVISNQEFPSNRIVWESLGSLGVKTIEADIGTTDPPEEAVIAAMTDRTRLVSISSVQYSTGLALDLETIGAACQAADIAFCVDAIQSIGVKPIDVQACHADFVVADGHKWMLGPEGLALFYCREDWIPRLSLKQFGWHMVEAPGDYDRRSWHAASSARRFECGSPNMLGVHALHASVELLIETGLQKIHELVSANISYLIDKLIERGFEVISETAPERRAGILTFRHPETSNEKLYSHLQSHGVICALRGGGVRFSPHFYTGRDILDRAINLATQA